MDLPGESMEIENTLMITGEGRLVMQQRFSGLMIIEDGQSIMTSWELDFFKSILRQLEEQAREASPWLFDTSIARPPCLERGVPE